MFSRVWIERTIKLMAQFSKTRITSCGGFLTILNFSFKQFCRFSRDFKRVGDYQTAVHCCTGYVKWYEIWILEMKLEHLSAFIHTVDSIIQSSWYEYKWRQFQSIKDKLNPPTLILFCQNTFHYLQPPSTIGNKYPSSLSVCTRVTF